MSKVKKDERFEVKEKDQCRAGRATNQSGLS